MPNNNLQVIEDFVVKKEGLLPHADVLNENLKTPIAEMKESSQSLFLQGKDLANFGKTEDMLEKLVPLHIKNDEKEDRFNITITRVYKNVSEDDILALEGKSYANKKVKPDTIIQHKYSKENSYIKLTGNLYSINLSLEFKERAKYKTFVINTKLNVLQGKSNEFEETVQNKHSGLKEIISNECTEYNNLVTPEISEDLKQLNNFIAKKNYEEQTTITVKREYKDVVRGTAFIYEIFHKSGYNNSISGDLAYVALTTPTNEFRDFPEIKENFVSVSFKFQKVETEKKESFILMNNFYVQQEVSVKIEKGISSKMEVVSNNSEQNKDITCVEDGKGYKSYKFKDTSLIETDTTVLSTKKSTSTTIVQELNHNTLDKDKYDTKVVRIIRAYKEVPKSLLQLIVENVLKSSENITGCNDVFILGNMRVYGEKYISSPEISSFLTGVEITFYQDPTKDDIFNKA